MEGDIISALKELNKLTNVKSAPGIEVVKYLEILNKNAKKILEIIANETVYPSFLDEFLVTYVCLDMLCCILFFINMRNRIRFISFLAKWIKFIFLLIISWLIIIRVRFYCLDPSKTIRSYAFRVLSHLVANPKV